MKRNMCLPGMTSEFTFLDLVMKSGEYRRLSPYKFKEEMGKVNPIYKHYRQQDAHEALIGVINNMEAELIEIDESNAIAEIFEGGFTIKTKCQNCHDESESDDSDSEEAQ